MVFTISIRCSFHNAMTGEFLMRIGERIGRLVKVDQAIDQVLRGKYARICVEVDITKPLLERFKLRRRIRRIEYEGIHLVCFQCEVYI